jgi:hypothetical protein
MLGGYPEIKHIHYRHLRTLVHGPKRGDASSSATQQPHAAAPVQQSQKPNFQLAAADMQPSYSSKAVGHPPLRASVVFGSQMPGKDGGGGIDVRAGGIHDRFTKRFVPVTGRIV